MATRATNEAVETYRKWLKTERTFNRIDEELRRKVHGLSPAEFDDYGVMTQEIDRALNLLDDNATEPVLRAAASTAGRDRG